MACSYDDGLGKERTKECANVEVSKRYIYQGRYDIHRPVRNDWSNPQEEDENAHNVVVIPCLNVR